MSPDRRSMPIRPIILEVQDNEVSRRRGSVYQSSREVRKMMKLQEQRRIMESIFSGETFLSFDIVNSSTDSTLQSKNGGGNSGQRKRSSQKSSHAELSSKSLNTTESALTSSQEFLDLSYRLLLDEKPTISNSFLRKDMLLDDFLEISHANEDCRTKAVSEAAEKGSLEAPKWKCVKNLAPENGGNTLSERDKIQMLPKSFSAKVGVQSSPNPVNDGLFRASPKTRFGPFRRILDPISKSKSLRNPSFLETESGNVRTTDPGSIGKSHPLASSLSDSFSAMLVTQKNNCDQLIASDETAMIVSSPVHLNGILKLENRQSALSFEFSLKGSEEILTAKTWGTSSAFNWVYTFHTKQRKKNNTDWGLKDRNKQTSLLIGQMQVSCYLCSEVGSNGSLDNFTALEFVLYDTAWARRSSIAEERSHCSVGTTERSKATRVERLVSKDPRKTHSPLNPENNKLLGSHFLSDFDISDSHPWAPTDLLPHLEVAAILIQIPFEKKENLTNDCKDEGCMKKYSGLSNASVVDHGKTTISNNSLPVNMKVITPSGRHGLPSSDGCPSSLLYRWRSGGRCDCGGWDMGCPIFILDSTSGDQSTGLSKNGHLSFKLAVQGSKDTIPALMITTHADGQFEVNFHAQFSTLQAFSISIAILHLLESFKTDCQENMPILHSNSLKLLLEEEVGHLLDAVAEEKKRKTKRRVLEPTQAYCVVDPPFSPIGRI